MRDTSTSTRVSNCNCEINGEKLFQDTQNSSEDVENFGEGWRNPLTIRSKKIKDLVSIMAAIQDSRMESVS